MNPLKKSLHLHLFLSLYIFLAFLKVKYVQADAAPETMKGKKILPNDTTKGLRGRRKLIDEETDPNALDEVVNKINSREQGNVTTGNAGETRDVTTEDAGETHNVTTGIERQQIRATFTTMRGACRVRNWSRGDEGRDYDEYYGWSYDKCKRKCQERDYCKGFEHDDAGNRDCEIWYTRPTKAEKKKNYVCEYKNEDSSDSEESSNSDGSSDSEESSDQDESTDSDESSDPDESTDSDESSDLDEGSDSDESSDLDESSSDGDTEKNNETNDEEKIDSEQGNNGNDGELSNNNEKSIKIDEVNVYENENKKSSTEQSNESTDYW